MPFAKDATLAPKVSATLRSQYTAHDGPLGAVGINALALAARAGDVEGAVSAGAPSGVTYPKYSALGEALGTTAGLIRAKVGVKAVAVDAGGWDHHVDLGWRVDSTIEDLAACLAAFFTDLGPEASRVTVVTLSEFGRRLAENGSRGVDHGYGNAVLPSVPASRAATTRAGHRSARASRSTATWPSRPTTAACWRRSSPPARGVHRQGVPWLLPHAGRRDHVAVRRRIRSSATATTPR